MNRRSKGFTLMELLCTILIMLLVSLCVNVGIRLAVESYSSSITQSEAQVLCATVTDLVCDELRFSGSLEWSEDGTLYFADSRGVANRKFVVEDGQVLLGYRQDASQAEKLLPGKAYPNGLRADLKIARVVGSDNRLTVTVTIMDRQQRTLAERKTEIEVLRPSSG